MTAFQYKAFNQKGKEIKGVIEADSVKQARQSLKNQSLFVIDISPYKKNTFTSSKQTLSADELTLMTRQLATLVSAALPIEEALKGVSEQVDKPKCKAIMLGVRAKVMEGHTLSNAFQSFPDAFPTIYCQTIASGEQTGQLDLILEKLADHTEHQQKMRRKIQQALIYPIIMMLVSSFIVSFLLIFVVPKIIDVFNQSGQKLPGTTLFLITLSHFIQSYGIFCLIGLVISILTLLKALKVTTFKEKWDVFWLTIPLIGHMIKTIQVSRYIYTFGILFGAGVNILDTMEACANMMSSIPIKKAFLIAKDKVKEGKGIAISLKETHYLSPMATHLIASGEKSSQLSAMMTKTALHMDGEIERIINTGLTLLEPMVILMMGGIVMFIVLATLVPIFSMEQLV
jgi:general secretion pathway protein F